MPQALADALARDGISVEPYAKAADALAALPAGSTLLIDPRRITYGSLQSVPSTVKVVEAVNPSTFFKSRKTEAEAEHVRETMEQDGAALAEFFAWFEGALGRETITELTIDEKSDGSARAPSGLRVAELRDDRGLQCERRDAALPRDRRSRIR